ncbi:phosphate/phosphite/phosphonate ABC transporter substrate-binding protein [Luteimonas sp. Y-2-2-4F]|nr:phosphate/phosphite/phosphonate ABC transporter substrate-binding protein [Luteimonas sp. Y-2-2-4F]MCD9031532.1 phosphate/phosphite/phosphonate ABC transporter substrate-binding protein [Luteimonas sp. Y-2-2-4F]
MLCRLFCVIALLWAAHAPAGEGGALVLGRISDDPRQHYEQLRPLLDYVVPRMREVGIVEGRILMARDPQQMAGYLRRGRVDWVTETAASAMLLERGAGALPLLVTERNGAGRYHTVFFVRRDSDVRSLEDLRGRSIAFQSRASTSAFVVPAVELLARGLRLELMVSPKDEPPPDAVGFVFGGSESNISTWVHKRLVDAGAFSDLDWARPDAMPPSFRRDLRIVHETPEYPRALEMVRADLDPRVRDRLRQVLLEAADDPEAAPALRHFFGATRFVPLAPADEGRLDYIRRAVQRVAGEVE